MYTLRRMFGCGQETNFALGNAYSVSLKAKLSQNEWDDLSTHYWGVAYEKNKNSTTIEQVAERDCYGFVTDDKGGHYFLLPWQENYIMTESGKTFSNLTIK